MKIYKKTNKKKRRNRFQFVCHHIEDVFEFFNRTGNCISYHTRQYGYSSPNSVFCKSPDFKEPYSCIDLNKKGAGTQNAYRLQCPSGNRGHGWEGKCPRYI